MRKEGEGATARSNGALGASTATDPSARLGPADRSHDSEEGGPQGRSVSLLVALAAFARGQVTPIIASKESMTTRWIASSQKLAGAILSRSASGASRTMKEDEEEGGRGDERTNDASGAWLS
eukprot:6220261-Pyramimonas_sp.AAC.1